MAVRDRQENRSDYKSITGRLPESKYVVLENFAWNMRVTLAFAVSKLLEKAIKAECGEPYVPEVRIENNGFCCLHGNRRLAEIQQAARPEHGHVDADTEYLLRERK